MGNKQLTLLVLLKAKVGMEEKVKQELSSLVAPSRSEVGCVNYNVHQAADNKSHFMIYENWASKEILDKHLEMPYVKAWIDKAEELLAETSEVTFWAEFS